MSELSELSPSECEALLRAGVVGRVAFNTPSGLQIFPVNYAVVDNAIIVRTKSDGVLGRHAQDAALVFEVDYADYGWQRGWSVVVRGTGRVLDQLSEVRRVDDIWPPRPWAAGDRSTLVHLAWTEISGRLLGRDWDPLQSTPARRNMPG